MFDQEFVKQFAGLGSNAAMAKMPVPRTAPRYMDYEQAGEYIRRVPVEAIRACVRARSACGLRLQVEYRGGVGRVSLVVAAVRVPPTGREFDHDGVHAVVSMTTRRRRPW
jgi:hypothetical protein